MLEENQIQVAIIDDHAMLRQALKKAFHFYGKVNISIEASSYLELLNKLSNSAVDIIIMDLNMPDLESTTDTINKIHQLLPEAEILILTMHNGSDNVKQELIRCGIHSYIHKSADFELLIEHIINAAAKKIQSSSFNTSIEPRNNRTVNYSQVSNTSFSEREKKILQLIVKGFTNIEISKAVYLSVRSIEEIRRHMKERVNVKSTASLVDFVIRNKVIE